MLERYKEKHSIHPLALIITNCLNFNDKHVQEVYINKLLSSAFYLTKCPFKLQTGNINGGKVLLGNIEMYISFWITNGCKNLKVLCVTFFTLI